MSSKATLRVPLEQLLPLLPPLTHQALRDSRFYARNSNSIVIQADESRKQSDNSRQCLVRLHSLIREIAQTAIPGETSEAQKERVKKLLVQACFGLAFLIRAVKPRTRNIACERRSATA
jgi:peptidyl-tRNA hydrolase ICT1